MRRTIPVQRPTLASAQIALAQQKHGNIRAANQMQHQNTVGIIQRHIAPQYIATPAPAPQPAPVAPTTVVIHTPPPAVQQIVTVAQVAILTSNIQELNKELEAKKVLEENYARATAELNRKIEALNESQKSHHDVQIEVESLNQNIAELNVRLQTAEEEKAATVERVAIIQKAVGELTSRLQEMDRWQKQIDAQNQEIANLRKALDTMLSLAEK